MGPDFRRRFGNTVGAFADGAILFPLLAALSLKSGFQSSWLLCSAGATYLMAGFLFRVPMSVQPLKVIVIGAMAVGATSLEVRVGGALLGVVCLFFSVFDTERLAARVPTPLVHGLQLGLGILLITEGMRLSGSGSSIYQYGGAVASFGMTLGLALVLVFLTERYRLSLLGLTATLGLAYGILTTTGNGPVPAAAIPSVRWNIVAFLVLPQIVLTLSNSVLGTVDVTHRYFGRAAERVTPRRLLHSIGWGNLLLASVGGLPFCHGAGGVTAHVKGGATDWRSNSVIGLALITLAFIQYGIGTWLPIHYPSWLLALLLVSMGIFHLGLVRRTWEIVGERPRLVVMAMAAVLTRNMLTVLGAGLLADVMGLRTWPIFRQSKGTA